MIKARVRIADCSFPFWRVPVFAGLVCASALSPCEARAGDPPVAVKSPLSPEESLRHLRIANGLKIELAAAEPEVVDPVSIAFDEDGRMYVVEMRDYPTGPKPGESPLSQIKLLEDRDHDGRYETAHVFADKLLFATGVQPWRGGVIVTLAGEIAYFKDTDGDHKADVRETWFRGFVQENPQLRANHPTFALDNHIYVANGLRGGAIVADEKKWGKKYPPVSISGKDFRFDPHTGECEAVAGNGQFGMTFDDFGNRFICDNRHPCRQVMLEDWYTKRNPYLAVREVVHDVCPPGEKSRIFPIRPVWTTSTLHAGQFTAACGVLVYRGSDLPNCNGNIFVCEPTGSLVHRAIPLLAVPHPIVPGDDTRFAMSNAAYTEHNLSDSRTEFLASDDPWFRAVDLANGPDGALYVVDMYRAVIEHPDWVPEELKNRPDAWDGNDRGRIYRVTTRNPGTLRDERLSIARATSNDLVSFLMHKNAWHRATAARLLCERQDRTVAASLTERFREVDSGAAGKVAILGVLDGLRAITPSIVEEALSCDSEPARRFTLRLAERWLRESPEVQERFLSLPDVSHWNTPSSLQMALSLGELPPSEKQIRKLISVALEPGGRPGTQDVWVRRAVLSSMTGQPHLYLEQLLNDKWFHGDWSHVALLREMCEVIGARQKEDELLPTLAMLASLPELKDAPFAKRSTELMLAGIRGVGQGFERRGDLFSALLDRLDERETGVKAGLGPIFAVAIGVAQDDEAKSGLRSDAVGILQYGGFDLAGDILLALATKAPKQSVRLQAIDAVAGYREPKIADALLDNFAAQTPVIRRALLAAMLRDADRTKRLIAEIAAKRLLPTELDPLAVQALLNHKVDAIRDEAKQVLAALVPADRKKVLDEYQPALSMAADAKRGRLIFEKNCTACHKIGDLGVDVAPDIADSRTKTPAQLLTDILSPNQAIDNNYVSYVAITTDGKSHTGVIGAETPVSITIRQPEGKTVQLLRADIEELRSSGVSLMPEGLEKNITVAQMADLISFIKNWRYLDGAVPIDTTKLAK